MSIPTPPNEFHNWLDYAIATMDARGAYLDRIFDADETPTQDKIRAAAQDELDQLRQKVSMPWIRILENWQSALSKRLGRSAEVILEGNLLATDFSDSSVHIHFEDGTDLTFRRAFYLGETPADGAIHRVVVFTEHCGYHEFWVGPDDRIELICPKVAPSQDLQWENEIRQSQAEVAQGQVVPYKFGPASDEELAWDNMVPVGREFGSPDYDRLNAEDAVKFSADLARWIRKSSEAAGDLKLDDDERSDALNVQLALRELGQEVSVEVAASVWKHYSQSLAAIWMAGADTVKSAARTLYLNCPSIQN